MPKIHQIVLEADTDKKIVVFAVCRDDELRGIKVEVNCFVFLHCSFFFPLIN